MGATNTGEHFERLRGSAPDYCEECGREVWGCRVLTMWYVRRVVCVRAFWWEVTLLGMYINVHTPFIHTSIYSSSSSSLSTHIMRGVDRWHRWLLVCGDSSCVRWMVVPYVSHVALSSHARAGIKCARHVGSYKVRHYRCRYHATHKRQHHKTQQNSRSTSGSSKCSSGAAAAPAMCVKRCAPCAPLSMGAC